MIERAIENWLISTTERNYTVPFCQTLVNQGHEILYISTHGPGEFGKDVITRNNEGEICAFQLKTGNLTSSSWDKSIRAEVEKLVEIPAVLPSFAEPRIPDKAWLVINGKIANEIKVELGLRNAENIRRGYAQVDTKEINQLVKDFIDAQGEFLPTEPDDFYSFLKFYLDKGDGLFPKKSFTTFLDNVFFNETSGGRRRKREIIASSIIMTSYLLNAFQRRENAYAMFEAWVCLAASILCYCLKTDLGERHWRESWRLVINEIERHLDLLMHETLGRETLLEGDPATDGGFILRARNTMVYGTLAAYEIYNKCINAEHEYNIELLDRIKDILQKTREDPKKLSDFWFWGESVLPFFFNIIKFLELYHENELAKYVLYTIFRQTIMEKFPERVNSGVANPYYPVQDHIEYRLNLDPTSINFEQFFRSSYMLEALILLVTRRNGKEFLEENWRIISHFRMYEFIPDNVEDFFKWRVIEGRTHLKFPKETQSWKELQELDKAPIPLHPLFYESFIFLIPFTVVYPHRLTTQIIQLLEHNIDELKS